MLIPLRHENMQGRRWPVITIGIIALNLLIFLGTHWTMDKRAGAGEVRVHILLLAAMHPELKIDGKAQDLVTTVQTKNPGLWKEAQNQNRGCARCLGCKYAHAADEHPAAMQQEMDSSRPLLGIGFTSIVSKFAFRPGASDGDELPHATFCMGLAPLDRQHVVPVAPEEFLRTLGQADLSSFYLIAACSHCRFMPWSTR